MNRALPFYFAVYFLGLAYSSLAIRPLGALFCGLAAFPLGLFLWVLLSVTLIVMPVSYQVQSSAAAFGGLLVSASLVHATLVRRGSGVKRGDLPAIAICAAFFGLAAAGIAQFNLSVMTFDSHQISILGRSIAFHGGIEADLGMGGHGLDDRGIFQVLIQSVAIFVDTSYLYAITPIFGFSFLALYAYLAARALGGVKAPTGRAALFVVLTVVAMSTTYFMLVMMLALLESYAAGAYLALAVACFWLADRERSETWLHFAHPFLIAFALQRSETPLVALLFLAIAHARCRLPRRTLVFWLVVFAVVVVGWHGQLLLSIDSGHNRNPSRALLAPLIIGATLATTLGMIALHKPALSRLRTHIPSLVVICSVALFIWAATFRSDVMGTSLVHTFDNLKSLSWGGVWFLFALLALMSLGLPKVEQRHLFTCGAVAYLLLLFVAAAARGAPYRHGWGDSGNRMLVHIVPLLFFYFLLVFGRGPGEGKAPASSGWMGRSSGTTRGAPALGPRLRQGEQPDLSKQP